FGQLQSALNTMWDVKPKPDRGWRGLVRDRFLSFTMVLAVAFILLASLAVTAALSSVGKFLGDALPGGAGLWQVVNSVISLAVITGLFALIFKVVPDAKMRWRDAAVGGAVTAVLFTIGKYLLGLYLGRSSVGSAFGAAGSVVAFVVWVYYVSQILFMGAEFTQVYARMLGKPIAPDKHAIPAGEKPEAHPELEPESTPAPAPEARSVHAAPDTSIPGLMQRIGDDLRVLARDEIALAKLEAAEAARRSAAGVVALVLGAVLGLISLGLLCVTAVVALQPAIAPLWARLLIMSGVYVAAGGLLVMACVNRYQKAPLSLPEARQEAAKTARTLKEQVHGG
ncbi:MAG: YhjD/YihY/BrkB family envelope integrity protein, partial [Polyangiales bacterium]